jgi:hypothetical protein
VPKRRAPAPAPEDRFRQWHRLFGLLLAYYLADSPFVVEVEKDLSARVQRLDVVVVRRRPGGLARPLPDGLDDFADHNLITFKSFQESLDDWALKELTGHYVNYRKQVGPKHGLLPESDFRLYAVSARQPRDLFRAVPPTPLGEGVYDLRRGTDTFRVVVAGELPTTERNALLHLFSAAPDRVEYGAAHYRLQSAETSSIVSQLFEGYQHQRLPMSYTMQDFIKDFVRGHLDQLTPEERLVGLKPEQLLAALPPERIEAYLQRVRGEKPVPKKRGPKKER